MTDPIMTKVSQIELVQKEQASEIHNINTKVSHIENDMNDLKSISKSNTLANTRTSEKLSDIHLIMHEFKGGWRVFKWIAGTMSALIGLALTILTITQILNNGS